ncbi:hypothetical protein [Enterobacter hormaechei]|nr:hypothetical protein [Enterobacter hormaechei]
MYNIKFVYLFHENVSPALFAKIIRPSVAGQWIMSVPDHSLRSLFTRYDLLRTITGANPYQSGRDTRTLIAQDLEMGRVVAIDESFRDWSSVTEIFLYQRQRATPGCLAGRPGLVSGEYDC